MPPSALLPGQQHTPKAIKAMPATRATGMASVSSAPSNNRPTSDGTISNAKPVAASNTAAKVSTFLMRIRLVFRMGDSIGDFRHMLLFLFRVLSGAEVECQLVDLTGELKRTIVAILDHRDTGAGVAADVEVLVFRERDRDRVFHGL